MERHLRPRLRQQTATFDDELRQLRTYADAPAVERVAEPLQASMGTRLKVYGATASWLMMIFGLCYVALPLALAVVGIPAGLSSLVFNAMAFTLLVPTVIVGMELTRPDFNLARTLDPVLPAAVGGMLSWSVLHNALPLLKPFAEFETVELASFLAINGIEFTLIGMMLAPMVRTRLGAFTLGAAFQALYIFLFVMGLPLLF